ncbi:MAG: lacI, partial [Chloroflexi bacterium]|nr:lacI [Chloroflexota bacterium]
MRTAVNRTNSRVDAHQPNSRAAIRDIAERAGVSLATVSRVLNGRPDVAAATRATVLQYVREAGYLSNRVARASYESRIIALSVPYIRGDYITEVITGAVEALNERGARLLICSSQASPDPTVT